MKILIISEHDNLNFKSSNSHVITAALQLGKEIDLLIAGTPNEKLIKFASCYKDINTIIKVVDEKYEHQLPENLCLLIESIAKNYDYVLMPANTYGKNIMPRVAGLLDVAMVSDVIKIVSADVFERPIFAGNAIETVRLDEKIKLITVRTIVFDAAVNNYPEGVTIKDYTSPSIENLNSRFIHCEKIKSMRPDLSDAKIIVSGGRGFKSADNFKMLERFADSIGAAIGATRAAVDAGFAPNDWQVGQTGKIVAPNIYIAIGISGAIQHVAGIKDSKIIIAINNDPNAPIFKIADYYLQGDLFKILPELQAILSKQKFLQGSS